MKTTEEKWADGAPMVKARHIMRITDLDYEDGECLTWKIYEALAFHKSKAEDIISKYLSEYGTEGDGVEEEVIPRDTYYWGTSGNYLLTEDFHTANFDIWEQL